MLSPWTNVDINASSVCSMSIAVARFIGSAVVNGQLPIWVVGDRFASPPRLPCRLETIQTVSAATMCAGIGYYSTRILALSFG
jgi:hypothetical protein